MSIEFKPDAEMFVCMDPTGCYHVAWNEADHRAKMALVGAKDEVRYIQADGAEARIRLLADLVERAQLNVPTHYVNWHSSARAALVKP